VSACSVLGKLSYINPHYCYYHYYCSSCDRLTHRPIDRSPCCEGRESNQCLELQNKVGSSQEGSNAWQRMETCAVCKGAHCGKLFAPATATEGPPRKPPNRGRDGTGRRCPGMGRDGLGCDGYLHRVSDTGYQDPGIGRLGPGRARGERGLRHVVGRVSNPNVPCGSSLVPCVPRGARLVCWRLLCWRQLRLPLSGYRGAFLRPSILLTKALVQTWSKVWPLVVV
jgi:hypothetical protein